MYLKIKSEVLRFIKTWIELINGLRGQESDRLLLNLLVPILQDEETLKMFHSVNIHDPSELYKWLRCKF